MPTRPLPTRARSRKNAGTGRPHVQYSRGVEYPLAAMKLSNLLSTLASNPPDLPSRSGYYLGYLMAKQLDRGDLAALARMPPKQVVIEARKFLESLAASPARL
jgi:hypothetical protein